MLQQHRCIIVLASALPPPPSTLRRLPPRDVVWLARHAATLRQAAGAACRRHARYVPSSRLCFGIALQGETAALCWFDFSTLSARLQALTDLDVGGCGGAGDAFLLQLLGGRFWDVRDCLPVQRSGFPAHSAQNRAADAQCAALEALGVAGADFLDACAPGALADDSDVRGVLLLEQALQVGAPVE